MPKKKKGGKKGADLPGDRPLGQNPELKVAAEIQEEELKLLALQRELGFRTEEVSIALGKKRDAENRRADLRQSLSQERGMQVSVQRDYSRLFKAKQETLIDEVNGLENSIEELRGQIEMKELEIKTIAGRHDFNIGVKQQMVDQVKDVMRKQAEEFDVMMSEILEKFSRELPVAVVPQQLLNAGVPIDMQIRSVNAEMQGVPVVKPPPLEVSAAVSKSSLSSSSSSSSSSGQTTSLPSIV